MRAAAVLAPRRAVAKLGATVSCRHAASASQQSWVDHSPETDFPLQNLPFGVFATSAGGGRCATAIGDHAVDLSALAEAGLLADLPFDARAVFRKPALNDFMGLSRPHWRATRARLSELLGAQGDDRLRRDAKLRAAVLKPMAEVQMLLPAQIGDYTDFYSSREHATNVGTMFRGKDNALQPNWLHLPVGYHGRASSVVVSGTPLARPRGQLQADNDDESKGSVYGPSKLLDFELEIGAFLGGPTPQLGRPLTMAEAEDNIFGLVVMNDWSARDIQKWEYVPLGPFGAKNFGTTISPWIVTLDALEPFRCATSAGTQDPVPLPYLQDPNYSSYNINLEVDMITPGEGNAQAATTTISKSNFRHLYWSVKQQLVHHAVTGCNMKPGDLLGSGTISGANPGSYGSLLELTWRGRDEIKLSDGGTRKFIRDHDSIVMRGFCPEGSSSPRIGFGLCGGQILPAGALDQEPIPQVAASPAAHGFRNFELHGYWRSSSSWRVRVALAHHGVDFTNRPVHLVRDGGEQLKIGYKESLNAMAQVPALSFTDGEGKTQTMTQSLAIIDFLDSCCSGSSSASPLVPDAERPGGILRRAKALQIAEIINSGIQPFQNLSTIKSVKVATSAAGGDVDGRGFAAEAIRRGLAACEKIVKESGARFAVGDEVSVADLCIVPQLYGARRFGVDVSEFPELLRVEAECQDLPTFQAARAKQPDAEAP